MKWNDLSMKEKAAIIKVGVANGITKLDDIKNKFDDGGYLDYMEKLAKKKARDWGENEDEILTMMLNDNTYNYRAFYDNNRELALKMLTEDPEAHFSDVGKTVYHPTFSNESIYSGKKSQYNPRGTIGGTWKGNEYVPSESQLKNKDFNYRYTKSYLKGSEEYISNKYKKYDEGGSILGIDVPIEAEIGASFVPILGTLMDAEQLYKNPSWANAGALGVSLLAEIPFLKWLKAGKVAKVAKNASKFEEAKRNYERAAKVVDRMENTPNINPAKLDRARNTRGKAFFDMKVASPNSGVEAYNDLMKLRNQEFVNSMINGSLTLTDIGFNTYQQFGEE